MKIIKHNGKFVDKDTGQIIEPQFLNYEYKHQFELAGIRPIEPMTAKEEDREVELEKMLADNSGYYAEEKFDGTRATMHFFSDTMPVTKYTDFKGQDYNRYAKGIRGFTRIFSRRISKKTDWYNENTDLLPQLREINVPELEGTIIDGELFIPNRPFKDVSSTMNCLWDEAIRRQIELGLVVFHAFDIIFYKGVRVSRMPLWKRKELLDKVVKLVQSKGNDCVRVVKYSDSTLRALLTKEIHAKIVKDVNAFRGTYSCLFNELVIEFMGLEHLLKQDAIGGELTLSKKAYYEYIVASGGEGLILKDINGKYYHKRGREYTKLKKFLTREVIIIGFNPPTKEYKGKAPSTWEYWEGDTPVSKHHAMKWIGTIRFGVVVTPKEKEMLLKSKKGKDFVFTTLNNLEIVEVGETGGFDEETRQLLSNRDWKGEVIEVKANEIFLDTGKLRHPRFLRMRDDKSPEMCTWHDHVNE